MDVCRKLNQTKDMINTEEERKEEVLRECTSNIPQTFVLAFTRQDNKCSKTKKRLISKRY
jgi:hypothetical protein